jgi:hypothetical protein
MTEEKQMPEQEVEVLAETKAPLRSARPSVPLKHSLGDQMGQEAAALGIDPMVFRARDRKNSRKPGIRALKGEIDQQAPNKEVRMTQQAAEAAQTAPQAQPVPAGYTPPPQPAVDPNTLQLLQALQQMRAPAAPVAEPPKPQTDWGGVVLQALAMLKPALESGSVKEISSEQAEALKKREEELAKKEKELASKAEEGFWKQSTKGLGKELVRSGAIAIEVMALAGIGYLIVIGVRHFILPDETV